MSSIDERIVRLMLDNSEFERNVKTSLSSMAQLSKGLQLAGAARGLNDVSAASKRVSFSGITQGLDTVRNKFSAMSVVAVTALATITNKAVNAGTALVKSLTVDPIKAGLNEYQTKLNSIQTILANTQAAGTNLKQVTAALNELNTYSDQTIYNFAEMARNIGTFTAAGVDLKTSVSSIKGIANLAALSGSNAEQASGAMYQLSQAISTGKVALQDWKSVENAGMGGSVFKKTLAETAIAMGKLPKSALKLVGPMKNIEISGESFRDSISAKGKNVWLTSEVLTTALGTFTGDMKDAELAAQGFTKEQIKAIQATAKTARKAATVVKTGSQLVNVLQETAQSGWAETWELILGDFEEAPKMWTNVNNVLGGIVTKAADARNKMINDWDVLGGRTAMIKSVSNAFGALIAVVKPIKEAFREIFPATTGKDLFAMTVALRNFTAGLKIGADTAAKLKRTFTGVFALFDIARVIIVEVVKMFARLFGVVGEGDHDFLNTTASMGDFLVKLRDTLIKGGKLHDFFVRLGDQLERVVRAIRQLAKQITDKLTPGFTSLTGAFKTMFGDINFGEMTAGIGSLISSSGGMIRAGETTKAVWAKVVDILKNAWAKIKEIFSGMGEGADGVGNAFSTMLDGVNFDNILKVIQTGFLAGIIVLIKRFKSQLLGLFKDFGNAPGTGLLQSIKDAFGQLTNTLKSMQHALNAVALLAIAAAVGILTLAVIALSKIDAAALRKSLLSITYMIVVLSAAMIAISKFSTGSVQLLLTAFALGALARAVKTLAEAVVILSELDWQELAKGLVGTTVLLTTLGIAVRIMSGSTKSLAGAGLGLILLAVAIRILVRAVQALSQMDWKELAKGLVSVGLLLGALALFTKFSKASLGAVAQGVGLILLAVGIKILASAVKDLAELDWKELAKGLVSVGALLAALALFTQFSKASLGAVAQGAGLILLATGIKILASAVEDFGALSWSEIAKGLVSVTAILAAFALFSRTVGKPGRLLAAGVALIMISGAMKVLASAVKDFGSMDWETIGKGLLTMSVALAAIVVALSLMPVTSLLSATAILIMASALKGIAEVVKTMGGMKWEEIAKGLIILAGALGIIAIAMALMTGTIAGAAAMVIVAGAIAILTPALINLSKLSWEEIARGLTALAGALVIIGVAGLLLTPVVPTFMGLAAGLGVLGLAVVLAGTGTLIFAQALKLLAEHGKAGTDVIIALIDRLIALLPKVATALGNAVIAFAKTIAKSGPAIRDAIVSVLGAFLDAIIETAPKAGKAILTVVMTVIKVIDVAVPALIQAGIRLIMAILKGIRDNIGKIVDLAAGIVVNFLDGISRNIGKIIDSGVNLVVKFLEGIGRNTKKIVDAGFDLIIDLVNGIADSIRENQKEMEDAGANLGDAIIDGIVSVLSNGGKIVADAAKALGRSALDGAKGVLGIDSPSKEFAKVGKFAVEGFAQGLRGSRVQVFKAFTDMTGLLKKAMKSSSLDVVDATAKLKKLTTARKKDARAIAAARAVLATAKSENARTTAAYALHIKQTTAYKAKLAALAVQHDKFISKIQSANDVLNDAKKTRDDFNKSTQESFSVLPDLSGNVSLVRYEAILRKQIDQTKLFGTSIQKLRDLGLNEDLYRELLGKGTSALPFVTRLLTAGKGEVDKLNSLSGELESVAGSVGSGASRELYQAAVDSAAGIVAGLKAQQGAIALEMGKIANVMVKAIKKSLGIKSPSVIFAEIGQNAVTSLSKGLDDYGHVVEESSARVGKAAILAMSRSIADISDVIKADIDVTPTITPILDLSLVKKDAGVLNTIFSGAPIAVDAAYSTAQAASEGLRNNKQSALDSVAASTGNQSSVTFVQNNTSPKALSQAEIYRQTKNQLSVVKGALTT